MATIEPIRWQDDQLMLLDQRALPHQYHYLAYRNAESVAQAIREMVVRGAPAIGITAAFGVALAARELSHRSAPTTAAEWRTALQPAIQQLAASRPTAVNLFWALEQAEQAVHDGGNVPETLLQLAQQLLSDDIAMNHRIGDFGASLIGESARIYTHCNAGALATGGYGTALGVIRSLAAQQRLQHVYAGETRPWLQGSRLTAWELQQEGIPYSLVTEGAAGQLMRGGAIDWVVVGADRIAANGDVANKVGTYNLAVLARYHGVKMMVAAPTSTLDRQAKSGEEIPIEQRCASEVTELRGEAIAAQGSHAINPSFDVTPAELIDAIVTERGIIQSPNAQRIAEHLRG